MQDKRLLHEHDMDFATIAGEEVERAMSQLNFKGNGDVHITGTYPHFSVNFLNSQGRPSVATKIPKVTFPFQLVLGLTSGALGLQVSSKNSTIFNNELTFSLNPDGFDMNVASAVGNKIYLAFVIDSDLNITGNPTIISSAGWVGYPTPIHIDRTDVTNPFQDAYYLCIGEIVASTDPRSGLAFKSAGVVVKAIQLINQAQRMKLVAFDGVACLVTEAWNQLPIGV